MPPLIPQKKSLPLRRKFFGYIRIAALFVFFLECGPTVFEGIVRKLWASAQRLAEQLLNLMNLAVLSIYICMFSGCFSVFTLDYFYMALPWHNSVSASLPV